MEQDKTVGQAYEDSHRNREAEAGVQIAFMLGQLLSDPNMLFEAEIAHKEQEIWDAVDSDADPQMICALRSELSQLRLTRINAKGVYQNSHSQGE